MSDKIDDGGPAMPACNEAWNNGTMGMTPAELREAVARAMREEWRDFCDIRYETLDWDEIEESERNSWRSNADAALRVVREAMREATPSMCAAWECSAILGPHASFEELAKRDWATMLAASPLREE